MNFLDAPVIEKIRIAARWGVLDGVTTNLSAAPTISEPVRTTA